VVARERESGRMIFSMAVHDLVLSGRMIFSMAVHDLVLSGRMIFSMAVSVNSAI
jgi:hypothetical protein